MGNLHWDSLTDGEVTFDDRRWSLTGDLEILDRGEILAVDATQTDDVRHPRATLYFSVTDSGESLNPGALGDPSAELDTSGASESIVVTTEGRSYQYDLARMQYE